MSTSALKLLFHFTAAAAAGVCFAANAAQGPDWKPTRNVELVIPFAAGGGNDIPARIIQKIASERRMLDVSTSIVNKPGGGGSVGMTYLNQHAGDGHYLSITSTSMLTSHIIGSSAINYTDVTPILPLILEYIAVAVHPSSPIQNFKDLAETMKKDPTSLSFAVGGGLGNPNHAGIAAALKASGVDARKIKAVAFGGGGEAITAVMGGHVNVLAVGSTALAPYVKSGKLRVIAVAAPKRLAGDYSAIPTLREQGTDNISTFARYVVGPRGLPRAQEVFWERFFADILKTAEWKTEADRNYWESSTMTAADTEKDLKAQYDQLRSILSDLGMAK